MTADQLQPQLQPQAAATASTSAEVGNGAARALGSLVGSLLALVIALPWVHVESAASSRLPFDPHPWQRLVDAPPDYVFIGNSMLYTRLDEQLLAERLGGPVAFLSGGGAMSAQWYLRLKDLLEAGLRPRHVVVTFRDEFLTRASMRTTGTYRTHIEELTRGRDELLERLIGELGDSPHGLLEAWLPTTGLRRALEDSVDELADQGAARLMPEATRSERKAVVNDVFAVDKLRADMAMESAGLDDGIDGGPFGTQLERSFLPAMVALAREAGVPLTFVRVQRRRRLELGRDAPRLATYMADLQRWLERNGAGFVDMNGEPGVSADMYGEGDHIADDRRADYTELFVRLHGDRLRGTRR